MCTYLVDGCAAGAADDEVVEVAAEEEEEENKLVIFDIAAFNVLPTTRFIFLILSACKNPEPSILRMGKADSKLHPSLLTAQ